MDFPRLYGIPANGKKIKEWSISVYQGNNTAFIKRIHGYQGCKMQENIKEITKGKNIGKKNETTPLQQAMNEAKSFWKKQVDTGYVQDIDNLTNQSQTILPMLAHDFHKRGKDITFPCYVQPKLDGVRLLVKIEPNNQITFLSRTGKVIENFDHIKQDIQSLKPQSQTIYLDGELFTFDIPFEEISGLFRKQEKTKQTELLKFHIFDIHTEDERPFTERMMYLKKYLNKKLKSIIVVETLECDSIESIQEFHSKYMLEMYEGLIIRNKLGLYKPNYRSKDLQKYKEFMDEEFEIVGAQSGVGLEQDCAIFTCKTKDGKTFAVRPRGTRELRKEYLKNIKELIGKQLTVRYQNLSEQGIVRFGVGIAIRDYE